MRVLLPIFVSASIVTQTLCQTPPGTLPFTKEYLDVAYYNDNQTFPTVKATPSSRNQTYQLLMLDLSIPVSIVNISTLVPSVQTPLAPGISPNQTTVLDGGVSISPNRTTFLHFWQTGLSFDSNGTLINTTDPIAFYLAPNPIPGDIAHFYVLYLFESNASFTPPPAGNPFSQALVNEGTNRLSFNVNHLAGEKGVGPLVGANYIQKERKVGSGQATGTGGRNDVGLFRTGAAVAAIIFVGLLVV